MHGMDCNELYNNLMEMKSNILFVVGFCFLTFFTGCDKEMDEVVEKEVADAVPDEGTSNIPDGYFEVVFIPQTGTTRAAVSGADGRIRHLRYVVYKSTGEYVKEKVVLQPTDAIPSWPLNALKDTLPKGQYTAVFLGNVEKTLFPVPVSGGGTTYSDVLLNYQSNLADARIALPNAEFSDTSEYYWAKVDFSDTSSAQPTVLLQRIISVFKLHRNFVDAQAALDLLTDHILNSVDNDEYRASIKTILTSAIDGVPLIGGSSASVVNALLSPVTAELRVVLKDLIVNQISIALTGNADQNGTLSKLGILLNPWSQNNAGAAIVTIRDFPKIIDFSLAVQSYYTGDQRFKYALYSSGGAHNEKDVLIKGLNTTYDVRKINVVGSGLVTGVVVDQVIDTWLLTGMFVDINDPIQTVASANYRYKADYSFVDLRLKSYAEQNSFNISVKLANIANIDGILGGVLGTLTSSLLSPIKKLTITVPVKLPLLDVSNMEVTGGWSEVTNY